MELWSQKLLSCFCKYIFSLVGRVLLENECFNPMFMIIIIRLGKIMLCPYNQQDDLSFGTSIKDCKPVIEINFKDITEVNFGYRRSSFLHQ